MPISDVTPQSIRKVAAEARTRNEVCRLPPAPNASPQPRMVNCIAPILSPSHRGASVNAPLGISADSSRLARVRATVGLPQGYVSGKSCFLSVGAFADGLAC